MKRPQHLVLVSAVVFGTTGTAQALGPDGTTPLTVGAARTATGGGGRVPLAIATPPLTDGTHWPPGPATAGALGVVASQLCFFAASTPRAWPSAPSSRSAAARPSPAP